MNRKRMKRKQTLKLAAAAALTIIAAACSSPDPQPSNPYTSQLPLNKDQTSYKADSPQKNYFENSEHNGTSHPIEAEAATDNIAFTESSIKSNNTTPAKHTGSSSTNAAWFTDKPALLELSIGDSEKLVKEKYGKELDSYTLSDGAEQINVYEYDGFAIGLNEKKTVHFIELYGGKQSAGLNGLKIGDTLNTALKALGKPDTQTEYLLTYQAEGAFLKLDLDPSLNEIISMKLLVG